jgi:hypothetical protein
MCDVVLDFGNEREMRAIYQRQRRSLIPFLLTAGIFFGIMAIVLNYVRWEGKPLNHDAVILFAGGSLVFFSGAVWHSVSTYESWMKGMPQVPRIAGD